MLRDGLLLFYRRLPPRERNRRIPSHLLLAYEWRSSNDAATRTQIVAPKREDNQVLASADFGPESVLECPLEQEARALMALVPTETVMLRR